MTIAIRICKKNRFFENPGVVSHLEVALAQEKYPIFWRDFETSYSKCIQEMIKLKI